MSEQNPENKRKILVVEDTSQLRDALERYLRQKDLSVIGAVDGEEGLAKSESERPDFILADIFMPRLGGIDMVKRIRATEWGRNIPVMLLSNFSLDKDSLDAVKQLGRLKYMTKADFSLHQVIEAVMEMMDRYQGIDAIGSPAPGNYTEVEDSEPAPVSM